jgi:CRISPR-associated protein Cas2
MYVVVAYDIKNDKKRNKLAKELLKYGIRTQKSVFECEINKKELKNIKKAAKKFSNDTDLVSVYEINNIKRIGNVNYLEVDDFVF